MIMTRDERREKKIQCNIYAGRSNFACCTENQYGAHRPTERGRSPEYQTSKHASDIGNADYIEVQNGKTLLE